MQLDDEGRDRLRALAREHPAELDEAAYARIAGQVASAGPRVVRRARRVRLALRAGGGLCALGVIGWLALPAAEQPVRVEVQSRPVQGAAVAAARACERRALPAPQLQPGAGEAQHVALGEVGALAVEAGSAMWLDAEDGCRLRVRLLDGRVSVHAADLGGGELRVLTPAGDVIVRGTVFAVAHAQGALIVEVDEGLVSVVHQGQTLAAALDGGQRLRVAPAQAPVTEPLDPAERAALRATLGLAPNAAAAGEHDSAEAVRAARTLRPHAQSAAAPSSADELVAEADALWRRGELERARERYRQAGALSGATAEAAWLALARRELAIDRPAAARAALQAYRARFARGQLASEAAGIAFRAAVQEGDLETARRSAALLQRRHPGTPQAEAAARWLQEQKRP